MVFPMILNVEQIKTCLDDRQPERVPLQPFLGCKNGRGNTVADQKLDQVAVVLSRASIKSQRQ